MENYTKMAPGLMGTVRPRFGPRRLFVYAPPDGSENSFGYRKAYNF